MAPSSERTLLPWWWRTVGAGVGDDTFAGLLARHREPHRRYHTAAHVEWVLRHCDRLSAAIPLDDPPAVLAAGFFHDAVYDPTGPAGANEAASANLAASQLTELGWDGARTTRVASLIAATAGHEAAPDDHDMSVLLDADLAVLGADASAYAAYTSGVRAEYGHLDDETWRTGRSAVLRSFLDRATIFVTEEARREWEARARANLTAELATLTASAR